MRSTACKYDPCIVSDERGRPRTVCDDCKVNFISDRFLGEDLQRRVLAKAFERTMQKYTYVLIADAVGCNLDQVKIGDILFFYATRPISGLIGMAKVESKMEDDYPLWPDEIHQNKIKYPFRIKFDPISILSETNWSDKRVSIRHLTVTFYRGINATYNKNIVDELSDRIA